MCKFLQVFITAIPHQAFLSYLCVLTILLAKNNHFTTDSYILFEEERIFKKNLINRKLILLHAILIKILSASNINSYIFRGVTMHQAEKCHSVSSRIFKRFLKIQTCSVKCVRQNTHHYTGR